MSFVVFYEITSGGVEKKTGCYDIEIKRSASAYDILEAVRKEIKNDNYYYSDMIISGLTKVNEIEIDAHDGDY